MFPPSLIDKLDLLPGHQPGGPEAYLLSLASWGDTQMTTPASLPAPSLAHLLVEMVNKTADTTQINRTEVLWA